jgi:glycosyltransferase involved in cell wall biosynthesis
MSARPLVSVVIPAYNRARYLPRALDCVLGQTCPPAEIIVVDDGSTDDTAAVLAAYGDRVRCVRQANGGPSKARNTGIRHARHDLIAFLDADDWWTPDKLELQVPLLADDPCVGLVHADWDYYDEATGKYLPAFDDGHKLVGRCYPRLFEGNAINLCTVVIRKACLDRVGLFDERLVRMEDYDLWLRVARHYEFGHVPRCLAFYCRHPGNLSASQLQMDLAEVAIIERELAVDPALRDTLGAARVHAKMHFLLSQVGRHYLAAGERARAWQAFSRALEYRPPGTAAWQERVNIGRVYLDEGWYGEAHRCFRHAVRERPTAPACWAWWLATLVPTPAAHHLRAFHRRQVARRERALSANGAAR